jgi:hypothetical protein
MSFQFLSHTWFFILIAFLSGIVFILAVVAKKVPIKDSHLLDFGAVGFNTLSIIGGIKLAGITFSNAYSTNQNLDMNSIYTIYGGIAVIWLSLKNVSKKYKDLRNQQES